MRQVGILCAAAIVAVQENVGKLEGDHKNAKVLAGWYSSVFDSYDIILGEKTNYCLLSNIFLIQFLPQCNHWKHVFLFSPEGLNKIKVIRVDAASVETNIVSISYQIWCFSMLRFQFAKTNK